jgi:hypothetical protein
VIGTIGPFAVNQGVVGGGGGDLRNLQPATTPGAQGVLVECAVNLTVGTGGTAITFRLRPNSIAGTPIGPINPAYGVVAGTTINLTPIWLDTTLTYPTGILYVVTAQMTAASANSTINQAIVVAEDCNSFE